MNKGKKGISTGDAVFVIAMALVIQIIVVVAIALFLNLWSSGYVKPSTPFSKLDIKSVYAEKVNGQTVIYLTVVNEGTNGLTVIDIYVNDHSWTQLHCELEPRIENGYYLPPGEKIKVAVKCPSIFLRPGETYEFTLMTANGLRISKILTMRS